MPLDAPPSVTPFLPIHLALMGCEDAMVLGSVGESTDVGPAETLWVGEAPLVSIGMFPFAGMPHVARVWLVKNEKLIEKQPRAALLLAEYVRRFVEIRSQQFRRIEVLIDSNEPKHLRFVEWLGFTNRSTLNGFGPDGRPFYLLEKVK